MNNKIERLKQRKKILEQQLFVLSNYKDSFEKRLGKKGTDEYMNKILDEFLLIKQYLENYEE